MEDDFSAEAFRKSRAKRLEQERLQAEEASAADPELAAIRAQTARSQQDTLESSRHAVRQLKDTVEVGEATRSKLLQQGEQLDRIEKTAERADDNAQQSYESARDLHKHKGVLPFSVKQWFTGSKKKKEDKELEARQRGLDQQLIDSQTSRNPTHPQQPQQPAQVLPQRQYADDKEREIDENLDEMSSHLAILRGQAQDMNSELERQNVSIKRTEATVEHTDYTLNSANRKIKEFL